MSSDAIPARAEVHDILEVDLIEDKFVAVAETEPGGLLKVVINIKAQEDAEHDAPQVL